MLKINKIYTEKKNFLSGLVLLFVLFFNNWILFLFFKKEYLKIVIMILTSLILKYSYIIKKAKYLILLIPLLIILFSGDFSKSIFNLTGEEIYFINTRRSYYQENFLAKALENKPLRYFYNYRKNMFEGLDLNYYFFGNHPRERVGIIEIKKFSFIFLPFFLYGLFLRIKKGNTFDILYFLFSISLASLFRPIDIFSFIFFPFIALNIYFGIRGVLSGKIFYK